MEGDLARTIALLDQAMAPARDGLPATHVRAAAAAVRNFEAMLHSADPARWPGTAGPTAFLYGLALDKDDEHHRWARGAFARIGEDIDVWATRALLELLSCGMARFHDDPRDTSGPTSPSSHRRTAPDSTESRSTVPTGDVSWQLVCCPPSTGHTRNDCW